MAEWIDGKRLIDLVLVFTLIEFAVLAVLRKRAGKGLRIADVGANLLAGLCLMLAVRAAVSGAALAWVALPLLAAGAAHAVDMHRRWRR